MKILWLVNVVLPVISKEIGERINPRGGWLIDIRQKLQENDRYELLVVFPNSGKKPVSGRAERLKFFGFSRKYKDQTKYDKSLENEFVKVIKDYQPDIIHIWGTEYPHTLAMVKASKSVNLIDHVVISIQGLVSVIAEHYLSGIPCKIQLRTTIYNIYKNAFNMTCEKGKFIKRGQYEVEAIKDVNHIIGRTSWDKACVSQINPEAFYYHCNENLRAEFYNHQWDYGKCDKQTIFVSQANYSIKGFHFLLSAFPYILEKFPETRLEVAGPNILKNDTLIDKLKISSYGKYISSLVRKNNLKDRITFLGTLNEYDMVRRYLKANVFVSPSTIENSPNSVGEAMLLGVPIVSSNVGGVKDMLTHPDEGFLYQHDAPYMLAYYVCRLFENKQLSEDISRNAREHALETHDRVINFQKLIQIYESISKV